MPIPAVKIELHIQGCQQLVSDILSQFVIWANRIHVLENKLVLDVKEVQRKNALQDSSLGKNMLPLHESCHHESSFDAKTFLFHNLHQNEQCKVPKTHQCIRYSSKQMGNQATSFPPFYKTAEN